MKLPFLKKKQKQPEPEQVPMIRQQIIPKGVSSVVRSKEEIYKQARMRTRVPEEYQKIELSDRALAFLRAHNAADDQVDAVALTEKFHAAMERGLRGEKGGLAMLPTYFTAEGTSVPNDVPVAVLDAGGSHLRAARVFWERGMAMVEQKEVLPMPGSEEPVTWAKFVKQCADLLEPRLEGTSLVGVCFCYPAESTPDGDLKVLAIDKEVEIRGAKGKLVCASIAQELEKRGHTGLSFTSLNDTTAALIRGRTSVPPRYGSDFAGMVMGTGVNTAINLPVERIEKLGLKADGTRMIVNMESGFFSDVPQSDFDRLVDAATEKPGTSLFEKAVAGKYLGECCRHALRAAAQEGLFEDEATAKRLKALKSLDTALIDKFATNPDYRDLKAMKDATDADLELAQHIIIGVFRRAGLIAVCCGAALAKLTGIVTKDRYKPIIICVDGSVYNNSFFMHEAVTDAMQDFTVQQLNIYCMCKGVEQATLIGTAAAALLKADS